MPKPGIVTLDPDEVEVVLPAMTPISSHAPTPGAIRASEVPRPVAAHEPTVTREDLFAPQQAVLDVLTGGVKSLGRGGYNLGKWMLENAPGVRSLAESVSSPEMVNYAFGVDQEPTIVVPPSTQAPDPLTGAITPTPDEARIQALAEAQFKRREAVPEFGGAQDLLAYTNAAQTLGGVGTDIATALALQPELAVPRWLGGATRVGGLIERAAAEGGGIARTAARLPEVARQATVGAVLGQMQGQDPITGATLGAGLSFTPMGLPANLSGVGMGGSQAVMDAAADRALTAAKTRIGRAISPTITANKAFVEKNAEQIIDEVRWFNMGGLERMGERADAAARRAGQKIDDVIANRRQGDIAPILRSARTDLQRSINELLTRGQGQTIELAPQTHAALEQARVTLASLNPRDTNLSTLQRVHSEITDAISDVGMETTRRLRQTRMGWVGTLIDRALQGGAVSRARGGMRAGRSGVIGAMDEVLGTRAPTQPIFDALENAKNNFRTRSSAGAWVENVPSAIREIDALQDIVRQYGPEMNADQLRSLRQQWDNVVAGPDGKGWLKTTIAEESKRGAHRTGANAVRAELGDLVPEVRPLNDDFNFQMNLRDAIADTLKRRTGQTGGLAKTMSMIGAALGVGAGAATGNLTLVGTGVIALTPVLTAIAKSPEFNLLSAKTRLAVARALRSGRAEQLWQATHRIALEGMLETHGAHSGAGTAAGGHDLTDAEYEHERARILRGEDVTPGILDRSNPDAAYEDADPENELPDMPEQQLPGQLPGSDEADTPMPGDPDYTPGLDGPEPDPGDQARAGDHPLGPRDSHGGVLRAGFLNDLPDPVKDLLHWAERPLVSAPDLGPEHPTLQKLANVAAGSVTPMNAAFLAESALRPLAAATRLARPVEAAGRTLGGAMALGGLQGVQEGIEAGSPGQVLGGATQAGLGVLGMRPTGAAVALKEGAQAVPGIARRIVQGTRNLGTQAVVGPALALSAQEAADTPAMRRLIPDDELRASIVSGMQIMGVVGLGAAAYRSMTPTMKATTHAAGQLSLGRAESLIRREITPALEADVARKNPTWAQEDVMARAQVLADEAIGKAQTALERVHAESGGRALDPRTYERGVRPELRHFGDWYRGAKDMVREMIPAAEGEPLDVNGLTTRQAFGVDTLATFGTNTPPKSNYDLFATAAEQINNAPAHLSRAELLTWVQKNAMPGGNLFGMDPDKPGIPSLRNIVTGKEEGFGGRKIESYGINLAEGTRPDITGTEVVPATVDRWIYRAAGLPTEVPERTGVPVYRTNPRTGQPALDPKTGKPLVRGGDRTQQRVVALGRNEERYASEIKRLMEQLTARAEARGTPITAREIAAVDALAQRNAMQHEVPLQMQATRPTAVGSKWLGQSTPGNVSYEVIEQQLKRAGHLQGLDVDQAQAMLWYRTKLQSNLSHAETPEQGLPFPQQRRLAQTHERELAATIKTLPDSAPWPERVAEAKSIIEKRNAKLAAELGENLTGPDSGFSHIVATGTNPAKTPVSAVSIYPERQVIVPRGVRATQGDYNSALASYIRDNADLLQDPNLAVGGWIVKSPTAAQRRATKRGVARKPGEEYKHPMQFAGREVPEGTLVLDIVALPSNADNHAIAKSLGMEYLQDSIFDLVEFENVKTGGQSYGRRSPAAIRAGHERRPGVYARGGELTPEKVPGRLQGLREGGGLSAQQLEMLDEWEAEQRGKRQRSSTPEPSTAQERAPKGRTIPGVEGPVVVRKGPDFAMDGEWHVTLPNGQRYAIYKNQSPGGLSEWLVSGLEDHPISGWTKEELIQKLATLDESAPLQNKYRGGATGKTIKEQLAARRARMTR